jgi:hypothetical protein
MKKIYTLFLGTALLLAGTAQAQRNTAPKSIHPVRAASNDQRGGGPANDECGGAVNQNLAVGGAVIFTGDNTGATDTEELGALNVWETFTLSECADLALTYCTTNPAFGNALLSLFSGCPWTTYYPAAGFDVETCPDGNVTIFWTSVPAGQYYYAVMNDPDNAAVGPYTITVAATAAAIACVPYNECSTAMPITAGATCTPTPFLTTGASESMDPIECAGFESPIGHDVWFSFVATSASMTVGVTGYNESDAMVEVFSGSCGSLTSLGCADETYPQSAGEQTSEAFIYTSFTVGNTYYVRVYDYAHASPDHNFEICVTEGEGSTIGITEVSDAGAFSLFPNPGTGVFMIQYAGTTGLGNIEVIDVTGRVMYNKQSQLATGSTHSMDLTGLAAGNYTVRITTNGVRTEQRLVVK